MAEPTPSQIAAIEVFAREAVAVLGRIEAILLRYEAQAVVELEIVDSGPSRPPVLRRVPAWGPDGVPMREIRVVLPRDYPDAVVSVRCPPSFGVRKVLVGARVVHEAWGVPLSTVSCGVGEIRVGYDVVALVEPVGR